MFPLQEGQTYITARPLGSLGAPCWVTCFAGDDLSRVLEGVGWGTTDWGNLPSTSQGQHIHLWITHINSNLLLLSLLSVALQLGV